MKILFVLNSNKYSGAENVVCQIADLLNEHQFFYCSPNGPIEENLKDKNVTFIGVQKLNVKNLKNVINQVKPDIIHGNDVKASFIASLCCKKIPLIVQLHGNFTNIRKLSLKSLCYKLAIKKSKKAVFVSESCFNNFYFKKFSEKKAIIIRNMISQKNIEDKLAMDKNDYNFDVIFLGRLSEPKNPIRLINILKHCCLKNKNLKCAIVGDGEYKQYCSEFIKDNKLERNIKMFGFVQNPFKILKNSKVMLMTSKFEGTPMCALEAYSLGVPIVSTNTDLAEIIINGETGFIYENDEDAIVKINYIIDNLKMFKENCKKYFRKINDLNLYKSSFEKIYNDAKGSSK